jgi:hypothetical protein
MFVRTLRLIGDGETERGTSTIERDFARLRLSVLLYLIYGEAGGGLPAAARAMLFDHVIMPI